MVQSKAARVVQGKAAVMIARAIVLVSVEESGSITLMAAF